jgi:hypothetical protein
MRISVELDEDQGNLLNSEAERLGIRPEDLVKLGLNDLLVASREDFQKAAEYVLRKNADLYERLS